MRRTRFLTAFAGLTVTSTMLLAMGCTADSAALIGGQYKPFTEAGGTVTPTCDGDPLTNADQIREGCAIFVRSDTGRDDGPGSQANPFKTLQKAIDSSTDKWIIACAVSPFTEPVSVFKSGTVRIYGGFDCSGAKWTAPPKTPDAKKTTIATATDTIPFTVRRDAATMTELSLAVTSFAFEAASATKAGGSSIAAIITDEQTKAAFTNCSFTAGDAQKGSDGDPAPISMGLTGVEGVKGVDACGAGTSHPGGKAPTIMCPNGGSSAGGKGGDGNATDATSGADGSTTPPSSGQPPTDGKGGEGEGVAGALKCANGHDGSDGATGGVGKAGKGIGDIGLDISGYAGASGQPGSPGSPGLGGGGGGGTKGATTSSCPGAPGVAGASGGSGGTGGCGGAAGGGGKAGGSSIALISLGAAVTLTDTSLKTGAPGNGGNGKKGEDGGLGGTGGPASAPSSPVKASCFGGRGGAGGVGGSGGGGQGGHSLAIAIKGGSVTGGTVVAAEERQKGTGGLPGDGSMGDGKGADGLAADCWDFSVPDTGKSCAP